MLKKTIKYVNFEDEEVEEQFYFNLTKAELEKINISAPGGLEKYVKDCVAEQSVTKLYGLFETIIGLAYGEKNKENKFVKSQEITSSFLASEAYSTLLQELLSDENKAQAFMTGIMPKEVQEKMNASK